MIKKKVFATIHTDYGENQDSETEYDGVSSPTLINKKHKPSYPSRTISNSFQVMRDYVK